MPKTVTELITNLFSKSRSGKLVTDAAPLDCPTNDDNDDGPSTSAASSLSSQDISNLRQSFEHSISRQRNMTEESKSQESHAMPITTTPTTTATTDLARSGNMALAENGNINNTLAVNNTQGYNVYQFSQISGLHIGSVYNIKHNADKPADRRPKSGEPIRKTKSIDAMMKSTEPLTHKTMDIISTHLGEGWRDLVRHLGFSDGQIDQMLEDNYIRGVKEVIYQFLLDYSRNDDDNCLGHITRLLWKCGHRECVFILKEYWKNASNTVETSKATNGSDADEYNSYHDDNRNEKVKLV